ncbi:MAG: ThuA domain-containing protein [Clostridia bacterium]|nr:ThuA domain-containing protein [Clostridia bacterium]
MKKINVVVWNEHMQDATDDAVKAVYPDGMNAALKKGITAGNDLFDVTEATQDMPEHGLTEELLAKTDVLIWWAHCGHHLVDDEIVARVIRHVQAGMGFIALHSAHYSKPFTRLLGTTGRLIWRESGDTEVLWNVNPSHPITQGIGDKFIIPHEETYGEFFDIPRPDDNIFIGWFSGGEVFRSGVTFTRGLGKIFYFQPGHETNPTFYNENYLTVVRNAIRWANPGKERVFLDAPWVPATIQNN